MVIPMILEAFGGISPHSLHFIRHLARRTEGARAREKITWFIDVFTAERIIADRKWISKAFIVGGLLLVASQVFKI